MILLTLFFAAARPSNAQQFRSYIGEDGAIWESPTNWNPNLVPDSISEGARIDRSVNVNVGSNIVIFTLELLGISRVTLNQSNELRTNNLLMQGTVAGTGTLRIQQGGSIGTGTANTFDTVNVINEGTLEVFGVTLRNGAVFNNVNTINLSDNAVINDPGLLSGKTAPSLINTGFVRKDSGTGQATVTAPFDNQLEFVSTSGTLLVAGGGTNSGNFRTGPNGTLRILSREILFSDGAKITGEGMTRNDDRINVPLGATVQFDHFTLSGRLLGQGDIELLGSNLVFEDGVLQENIRVTVTDGATLLVKGGNSTDLQDTAELRIEPSGKVVFDEPASSLRNIGTGTLTNNGEIEFTDNGDILNNGPINAGIILGLTNGPTGRIIKSGGLEGDGETVIVGSVEHSGTIEVRQGRLEFVGDFEANAPLTVRPGAFLRYGGLSANTLLMRPGSGVGGGGTFEHEQGTIDIQNGVRAVFDGYRTVGSSGGFVTGGGTFVFGTSETIGSIRHSGPGVTEIPAGVDIVTTGPFDFDDGRTLRILGGLELAVNPISGISNATFDLQGTLRVTADVFVNYGSGTFAMQNNGTWIIAAPSRAGFGFNQYSGSGLLRVESGDVRFATRDLSLTGTIEVHAGAELEGSGLTFGPGSLLRGEGTLNGSPINFAGTTAPGLSLGTLAVDGRPEFQASSVLEIEVGAGGVSDRIEISSTATLGGTLELVPEPGYTPVKGDSWTLLNAASISGVFDAVNHPATGPGLYYFVDYTPTSVAVTYTVPDSFGRALEIATGQPYPAGTDFDPLVGLDPDGDGLPHIFEWAFGGDLNNPDPDLRFELVDYDATFPGTYTFRYPVNPLAGDVNLTLLASVSPGGPFSGRIVSNERSEEADGITWLVFDVALTPQDDARFFRLTAELD